MSSCKVAGSGLSAPWRRKDYQQHRLRVMEAKSAIDYKAPKVRTHIIRNAKGLQLERERQARILQENFILLKKLQTIMHRKGVKPREDSGKLQWSESRCIRSRS